MWCGREVFIIFIFLEQISISDIFDCYVWGSLLEDMQLQYCVGRSNIWSTFFHPCWHLRLNGRLILTIVRRALQPLDDQRVFGLAYPWQRKCMSGGTVCAQCGTSLGAWRCRVVGKSAGVECISFCGSFCVLMQGTQIWILAAVDACRETCMMRTESGAQHGVASTRE